MRRLLELACILVVTLVAAQWGPAVAVASQTCNTTCSSGAVITCTVASGTCSSSPGSVSCCGQVHDCSAIDAHETCINNCDAAFDACASRCRVFDPCVRNCATTRNSCYTNCGPAPQTSFSC
jgi:hypothetical protein